MERRSANWLVCSFCMSKLAEKFGKENVGLYRDDGLALVEGVNGRKADKARKNVA